MEVLFFVKIFYNEISSDLYVFRSPECEKLIFENWSVLMHVCMCACALLCGEFSALYVYKSNKDRSTKFYTQKQKSAFLGFERNLKIGCGVEWTGSEYLKNGSNDFLQICYINTYLHVFYNVLVRSSFCVYRRKIRWSPNLVAQF